MDPDQQEALDHHVQEVLAELQAAGEPVTAESVRQRVGRRMSDVLSAMKRVAGVGPASEEPDADLPAEQYPAVLEATHKVESITAARQDAERLLQARETLLVRAEAAAAEALIDSLEPLSCIEARQAVLDAADMVRLLELAQTRAKTRAAEALVTAQAERWARQWRQYQAAVQAFDAALAVAHSAQTEAMRQWNAIGQPQEPPLLKAGLGVYPEHFHGFLQDILDMAPEQVRRGAILSGGLPPRTT